MPIIPPVAEPPHAIHQDFHQLTWVPDATAGSNLDMALTRHLTPGQLVRSGPHYGDVDAARDFNQWGALAAICVATFVVLTDFMAVGCSPTVGAKELFHFFRRTSMGGRSFRRGPHRRRPGGRLRDRAVRQPSGVLGQLGRPRLWFATGRAGAVGRHPHRRPSRAGGRRGDVAGHGRLDTGRRVQGGARARRRRRMGCRHRRQQWAFHPSWAASSTPGWVGGGFLAWPPWRPFARLRPRAQVDRAAVA